MALLLFLGCLLFSTFSAGIFWILQIVHYPSFKRIAPKDFNDYFQMQQKAEQFFVWIPSTLAALLSLAMIVFPIWNLDVSYIFGLISLTLVSWMGSAWLIIPQMRILEQHGYSQIVFKKLTQIHWFRTLSWTICSIYLFYLLFQLMGRSPV